MKSAPVRQQGIVYGASRLVAGSGATFSPGAVAVADGTILLAGRRRTSSGPLRPASPGWSSPAR